MNKKILILTHPLTGNYGGLLQAYASYTVLNSLGCNAYIYRYTPNDLPVKSFSHFKYYGSLLKLFLGMQENRIWRQLYIANQFTKKMKCISEPQTPLKCDKICYVVGSDQVWRAIYCRQMKSPEFYFLSFATTQQRHNSIAYAASFGIDEWEGNEKETRECSQLLNEFKAVSVREQSGINICRSIMNVEAVQMPDPTLLLERKDYENIINESKTWMPKTPWIASYILDESPQITQLLGKCSQNLNVSHQSLIPSKHAKRWQDRIIHTVPQWLRLIRNAKYFITDSFHGCVFAIIFNKPFVCLGNKSRGSARFESLLKTFGLESRLISSPSPQELSKLLKSPIDWEHVNRILLGEQERGINFLKEHLT